jgi:hypothetical protein
MFYLITPFLFLTLKLSRTLYTLRIHLIKCRILKGKHAAISLTQLSLYSPSITYTLSKPRAIQLFFLAFGYRPNTEFYCSNSMCRLLWCLGMRHHFNHFYNTKRQTHITQIGNYSLWEFLCRVSQIWIYYSHRPQQLHYSEAQVALLSRILATLKKNLGEINK